MYYLCVLTLNAYFINTASGCDYVPKDCKQTTNVYVLYN